MSDQATKKAVAEESQLRVVEMTLPASTSAIPSLRPRPGKVPAAR
jgi:hypothetical protein